MPKEKKFGLNNGVRQKYKPMQIKTLINQKEQGGEDSICAINIGAGLNKLNKKNLFLKYLYLLLQYMVRIRVGIFY